jgi:hypothetical protein
MQYLLKRDEDGTVRVVDMTRGVSETVRGASLKTESIEVPADLRVAHFKACVISNAA